MEKAGVTSTCYIIGDLNLDFRRWNSPDQLHKNMVEDAKQYLEVNGFQQYIMGITRSWPGQADSTIDHFWSNSPDKIVNTSNMSKNSWRS